MKKGYYLHSLSKDMTEEKLLSYGVEKKILAQCKAFGKYFDIEEKILYQKDVSTLFQKIFSRLPFTAISEKWRYEPIYDEASFIYFRKNIIDNSIVRFFKSIKKHNPNCKIILEIPTYPYDKEEFKDLKDLPYKLKDRINRKKLHKYVDRIVNFSQDDIIFGIETIKTINGIDFSSMDTKEINNTSDIHMMAVACFADWHGYDRVINGLAEYYNGGGKRNVFLHLVGEGVSINEYKRIVNINHLEDRVFFHGYKSGADLDAIYNICNISLDVFGGYKKDYYLSSSLKSREYFAKGLPIVSACKIDFIPDNYKYVLYFPNDPSIIEINKIINFFDDIYVGNSMQFIPEQIRSFAETKCDINNTLKPIINFIGD